jgi:hypothetical protein
LIFKGEHDASLVNATTGDTGAWRKHNRISLAGTSNTALSFYLDRHQNIMELVFCMDNDPAGRIAALMMGREYALKGYMVLNEPPRGKDFNEDLQAYRAQAKTEKRGLTHHIDL